MNFKIKFLHVSNKSKEKSFPSWLFEYRFFDYTYFQKYDDIIGMHQRIYAICNTFKPLVIKLNFNQPNMINIAEKRALRNFGLVL